MEKIINTELLTKLFEEAKLTDRQRQFYDLRTSENDMSQRMLNALLPGTVVPIHRHPKSSETIITLKGCMDEIIYDDNGQEITRYHLCPEKGQFGCNIPKGTWHSIEVFEPTIIFEAKDGKFGEDGSENFIEILKG